MKEQCLKAPNPSSKAVFAAMTLLLFATPACLQEAISRGTIIDKRYEPEYVDSKIEDMCFGVPPDQTCIKVPKVSIDDEDFYLTLEDCERRQENNLCLTGEIVVDKQIYNRYNIGDYFRP